MSKYTPEQIAAAQAAIRSQPASAQVVTAPYNVTDGRGHQIAKGTPVWSYAAGHPGGPGDPAYHGQNAGAMVEYAYRCLECAANDGWKEPEQTAEDAEAEAWAKRAESLPKPEPLVSHADTPIEQAVMQIALESLRALQWSANMLNHRQFIEALGWTDDDYSRNKFLEFQKLGRLHVFDDEVLGAMLRLGFEHQKRTANRGQ